MRKWLLRVFVFCFLVLLIFLLHQVFSGHLILHQIFNIGPLIIHYYGLTMAAAVAAGFYLAWRRKEKYQISAKQAEDIIFWVIIAGFIGARLYHVLSSGPYYFQHPADIVKVWNGGLSIYGAVIGGFIALIVCKKLLTTHYSLLTILDWLAPSLVLGQIIGRFGNLFNYEAFGYPTNLPWKMFVPPAFRPFGFEQFNFFHPFFLYEALGSAIILFILLKPLKKRPPGQLFFFYLLLYNILRFCLEFQRTDSTFVNGFRLNAVVSLILAIISFLAILLSNKYDKTP